MKAFKSLTARIVPLPVDDIDTDQIIPARFLKVTDKTGLGAALFAEWRKRPDFAINLPENEGAEVLVAGDNFGCGSSREHAPWALTGHGFRAVIARSFADIFKNNAMKNGLLPISIDDALHAKLLAARSIDPKVEVRIDLATQTVTLPDGTKTTFPIDSFAKHCMLEGVDELGYLLSYEAKIAAYEAQHT